MHAATPTQIIMLIIMSDHPERSQGSIFDVRTKAACLPSYCHIYDLNVS